MKSSTYYFPLVTKILVDLQICISVPLNNEEGGGGELYEIKRSRNEAEIGKKYEVTRAWNCFTTWKVNRIIYL